MVKSIFVYRDGGLYRAKNGKRAGSVNGKGYRTVKMLGGQYPEHRLIFLMFNGFLPENVDHIDRDKRNNSFENLRAATCSQNSCNIGITLANSTGLRGVQKLGGSWRAVIKHRGIPFHLGMFDSAEKAAAAYNRAAIDLHGEFACLNEI
jgi:hypothetical protein